MNFNIEKLDNLKIKDKKEQFFFISTFGCALVEEKKN